MTDRIKSRTYYATGLGLLVLGIAFLVFQERFSNFLFALGGLLLLLQGILSLPHLWKNRRHFSFVRLLFRLIIGGILVSSPLLPTHLLAYGIAVYQLIMGVFLLIHARIGFANALQGRWISLIDASLHIFFAVAFWKNGQSFLPGLYSLVGIYLIFLSFSSFRDGMEYDWGKQLSNIRRKRISLPIIVTAVVPLMALEKVNQFLNPENSQAQFFGDKNQKPDLEIWVHTARRGFERMGHVDIALDGRIYSYGNHDVDSQRLFETVGDGVLMTMPVEQYKHSLIDDSWRAVFGYGLILTAHEKAAVKERLDKIMADAQPFAVTTEKQKDSYLNHMMTQYGANAYKFSSGKFKTYFVMTTNCVQLVDDVVAATGLDMLDNHGILTPGAYHAYLDKEFHNPNSRVVSQMVIGKQA